ncbi:zinc finger MYM-type protein 1-like [Onthophagus taurus]|uniref:zinc finger MYM-type protein 1-like n=1 Tax=Onthophagus taurus TaxID=166361 RepID=UPI0039BDA589
MASTVRDSLLERIREAKYYGLMFDSTPVQAHREQMSEIKESFLGFLPISDKDAASLVQEILKQLEKDNMNLQDCRSQCYDNAAVMAGHKTGVHQENNNMAIFVNCDYHSLNLVGVHAAKEEVMMVTFLKSDSDTRWSAKTESVKPVNKYLEQIVEVLQNIMDDGSATSETKSDAKELYNRILTYDFLTLLGFWNKILIRIDRVKKRLQDPKMNFHAAALDLKALQNYFHDEREVLVSDSLKEGFRICNEWDIEFERRQRRKKRMDGETSRHAGLSAKEEMERVMKGTVDRLFNELKSRSVRIQEIDEKFGFLLDMEGLCFKAETSYLKEPCEKFGKAYSCDLDGQELYEEVLDFRMLLTSYTKKISSPEQLLNFIVQYGDENGCLSERLTLRLFRWILIVSRWQTFLQSLPSSSMT